MPKPDHRRQRIADEIRKLSEAASVLASRIKWATRDVSSYLPRDGDGLAEHLAHRLFILAQDVASGRVELDGPDSPRPPLERAAPAPPAAPFTFELVAEDGTPHPDPVAIHATSTIEAAAFAAERYPGWFVRIAGRDEAPEPARKPRKRKESAAHGAN